MRVINSVSRILGHASIGFIVIMMLLTVADVCLRYFFSAPIKGTTEITEDMMSLLLIGMAWAAVANRHITVDAVMNRMPKRFQAATDIFNFLLSLAVFALIAWRSYEAGMVSVKYQTSSPLLHIPESPIFMIMAVCFGLLCIAIIPILVNSVKGAIGK